MRRPVLTFGVCWIMGSALATSGHVWGVILAGVGLMSLLAQLYIHTLRRTERGDLMRRSSQQHIRRRNKMLLLMLLFMLAYVMAAGQRLWSDAQNVTALPELYAEVEASDADVPAVLQGQVLSDPTVDGDRVQWMMRTKYLRYEGQLRQVSERMLVNITLVEEAEQQLARGLRRGDQVQVNGKLRLPMTEGNIGAFNYREYLQTQRIHWLVQGKGYAASVLRAPSGLSLATVLSYLDDARAYTAAIITELYPGEQAGFMQGIILGTIDELDPEIYTDFSTLGLTHLLAISGLHVGVFMLFAGTVLHLLRISRERSALILLCLVPLYIIFTGAAPSAVRSGIMAMFGLWAARHQLFKDGLHLLALAATLMLISDPFYLEQVGFQLSFVVTAGLLLGVPLVRHLLPNVRRNPWRGIFDLLAVSLVAQLASLPIILYYFHQVHLLSLAVNLLLVPFVSFIILPLGMLSVLVALVMHTTLISSLIIFGNTQVFRLVALLSDVTALRLIWREPPLWWVFAVYAAFGGLLVLMKQRLAEQALLRLLPMQRAAQMRRLAFGVRGSGLALLILLVGAYIQLPPKASVLSFLNVGQGDAALVTTLSGAQILIDGGGSLPLPREPWRVRARPYDVGRQTVVPLLQQRGVRELDLVVLSHLDSDHIEGMRAVLANVPVRGVLWNGTYKDNALVEELFTDILARGIPLYRADEGDVLTFAPGVQLYVLGTGTEDGGNVAAIDYAYEQNSRSVGFILSLYGRNFLFTGDADDQEEAALMAHADHLFGKDRADRPTIDVMKVSHHGSRTSTSLAWLAYWQPQTAVISVGRNNLYNHPTPQVLTRLQIAQALVYRTDRDGEVQFRVAPDGTMDVRTTTQ